MKLDYTLAETKIFINLPPGSCIETLKQLRNEVIALRQTSCPSDNRDFSLATAVEKNKKGSTVQFCFITLGDESREFEREVCSLQEIGSAAAARMMIIIR